VTTLTELAREAASCTRCDLYLRATATVFGEGRPNSPLALVGEQPGDQEDKQGHPFVGRPGTSSTAHCATVTSTVTTRMSRTR
jgi:DNA polymerase